MDLTSPLHTLVPTMASAVLEVLAGTESGLGASQIERLASRGTRPGHLKALGRLTEHGLVIADPTNNGYLYRLNRQHVLVPALVAALGARRVFIERLTAAIADLDPAPAHAALFGSFARGEGTEKSDIDLLLVLPQEQDRHSEQWQLQLHRLEDLVLAWTGNQLEPLVFSYETLAKAIRSKEPIVDSLREESIRLSGAEFPTTITTAAGRKRTAKR